MKYLLHTSIAFFLKKVGEQGIDAFVSLKVGRSGAGYCSVVKSRNPMWNQEIHVPFVTPGMARKLELALFDYDIASANERIASHKLDVEKLKEQLDEKSFEPPKDCIPFWINFYGAPKNTGLTLKDTRVFDRMNLGMIEGTSYEGCLLLQLWRKKVREGRVSCAIEFFQECRHGFF